MAANQLHLLFVPIMTCFGLAFLLVQWNRLEIEIPPRPDRLSHAPFSLLRLADDFQLFFARRRRKHPLAALRAALHCCDQVSGCSLTEITASDMPWAVAWYADRRALWLPETVHAYTEMSDYSLLGGPINAIYLTPISGSQNTLRDILKGEYRDWARGHFADRRFGEVSAQMGDAARARKRVRLFQRSRPAESQPKTTMSGTGKEDLWDGRRARGGERRAGDS